VLRLRGAAERFGAADHAHGLSKWIQDALHRRLPTIAQLERAQLEDTAPAKDSFAARCRMNASSMKP